MTTTIDTTPVATFLYADTAPSDTISVTDGPPENGFQTTDIQTSANGAYILANKTSVIFDGGNKGDTLFLDNPDPAAGLQTLIIQNLGAGSTINGSNPNANSPDIAVTTLSLSAAGSIGNTRALRTQVSNLGAAAGGGGAGNINIANGVSAPTTLNIGALVATNAAGGSITLTNNGTINDIFNGITATGNIAIATTGATADFNTGSGAGITSNTGSVNTSNQIGEDTNLGDGVGTGSMSAATGISWLTGRNFTMNANATVTNSTSGNITITAFGDITMLTSPGLVAGAPQIVDNAGGGTISLQAGSGKTLTLNSTSTTAVKSNNGAIFLEADAMVIGEAINSGTARTTLAPSSSGQAISLGANNAPGVLGLTQAELNQITAATVNIGGNSAGAITIAAPNLNLAHSNTLTLISSSTISEAPFGSLAIPDLRISGAGPVTLNNAANNIQVLAGQVTGAVTVNNGINALTIGAVDGDFGIVTNNSAINLISDGLFIQQHVIAGNGIVTLSPFSTTQQLLLGGNNQAGFVAVQDNELALITASVVRLDATANITVANPISTHAGYNTLSLTTAGSFIQNTVVSVANLALLTGNGVSDGLNAVAAVGTLAFGNAAGAVTFNNSSSNALTIGSVDGLTSSWNAGTTTSISTGLNLTLATGISSAGATTLSSTTGKILDGDNGADVDVTAPSLALSASTGIGAAGTMLQTQTGTLSALTGTGGIFINNGAPVPATLAVGGGAVQVTGASGDIVLTDNGTIDVLTAADNISGPGNVTVKALGANADLNTGGQSATNAIVGTGSGLVDVEAGRDITLGNGGGTGNVVAAAGSVVVKAGRNITLTDTTLLEVGSGTGSLTATAGGNFTMTGTGGNGVLTAGGALTLTAGAGATMTLNGAQTLAVNSHGGSVTLNADNLAIDQTITAGSGNMLIDPVTAGQMISLGSAANGGLSLSTAALGEVTAKTLTIGNSSAGPVFIGGSMTPANVSNITINTGGNVTANGGSSISLSGALIIGFGENGLGATADLRNLNSVTTVVGGAGSNIFLPSTTKIMTMIGGSGSNTFEGTGLALTGDTITNINNLDKIVVTDGNFAHFSFQLSGNILSFDPDTSVSNTSRTLTLSNNPTGVFVATPDPVAGVDLSYVTPSPVSTPAATTAHMILQSSPGGAIDSADLGNNSVLAAYSSGQIGLQFQTLGVGNFSSNPGETDVLMRDSGSNAIISVNFQNNQIVSAPTIANIGQSFQVLGFGNFNGNPGESDMLMRDTTTNNIDYFDIQHNQIVASGLFGNIGPSFQILGFGDFSGNPGESDMLMRDSNSNNIYDFDIQHNQIVGAGVIANIGQEWQVLGIGDFSSNPGESDMLMRNSGTNDIDYFDIQHDQIVSAGLLANIGQEFHAVGFANIAGNANESDMVMRDVGNGTQDYFDIQHNQVTAAGSLGILAGTAFQPLGIGV